MVGRLVQAAAALSARGGQGAARSGTHMGASIVVELTLAPEHGVGHDDGVVSAHQLKESVICAGGERTRRGARVSKRGLVTNLKWMKGPNLKVRAAGAQRRGVVESAQHRDGGSSASWRPSATGGRLRSPESTPRVRFSGAHLDTALPDGLSWSMPFAAGSKRSGAARFLEGRGGASDMATQSGGGA